MKTIHYIMLKNTKGIILDIDGVLHQHGTKINNIEKIINKIQEKNIPVLLLTNDCRYTKKRIRKNLENYNINIPTNWEIYTSGYSVFDNLEKKSINKLSVYGSKNLKNLISFDNLTRNKNGIEIIVIGILDKKLTEKELQTIIIKIKNGAKIVLTAIDGFEPPENHSSGIQQMPLQVVKLIQSKIGIIDYTYYGKPSILLETKINEYFNDIDNKDLILVGDTLNTDILLANSLNIKSVLVLTGSSKIDDLDINWYYHGFNSLIKVDILLNSVVDLIEYL